MFKLISSGNPGMSIATSDGPIVLDDKGEAIISDEFAECFKGHPLFALERVAEEAKSVPKVKAPEPEPEPEISEPPTNPDAPPEDTDELESEGLDLVGEDAKDEDDVPAPKKSGKGAKKAKKESSDIPDDL